MPESPTDTNEGGAGVSFGNTRSPAATPTDFRYSDSPKTIRVPNRKNTNYTMSPIRVRSSDGDSDSDSSGASSDSDHGPDAVLNNADVEEGEGDGDADSEIKSDVDVDDVGGSGASRLSKVRKRYENEIKEENEEDVKAGTVRIKVELGALGSLSLVASAPIPVDPGLIAPDLIAAVVAEAAAAIVVTSSGNKNASIPVTVMDDSIHVDSNGNSITSTDDSDTNNNEGGILILVNSEDTNKRARETILNAVVAKSLMKRQSWVPGA